MWQRYTASLLVVFSLGAAASPEKDVDKRCTDLLTSALEDKNPDTRKEAVMALSLAPSRGPLITRLESMLDDKDVKVRLATVASLSDLKSPREVPALKKALQDPVPEVAFAAAKALYEAHVPAGRATLLSVLGGETKTSSGFIKSEIRDGMRLMHTPRAMLMVGLKQGIGFIPVPGVGEGVTSLQGILNDSGVSGRATAALLLGHEKDRQTIEALREALADKDWSVRAAAVHSLALQNKPALRKDFVPLLDDSKLPVRLRAAAAYLRLDDLAGRGGNRLEPVSATSH